MASHAERLLDLIDLVAAIEKEVGAVIETSAPRIDYLEGVIEEAKVTHGPKGDYPARDGWLHDLASHHGRLAVALAIRKKIREAKQG